MPDRMNEAIYGKNIADRMDAVDAALEELNVKHQDYFSSITSKYTVEGEDTPAKLQDYTLLQWNNVGASIGFTPDLPEYIANEVRQRFNEIVVG